jgi:radical SAM protein with 4Fe4S-binding SPASM domain
MTTKLFRISLNITKRCNLKCKHCFSNSVKKIENELNTSELFKLIDQIKEIGCDYLAVGGGEPFTRKDIFDILEYAKKNNINPSVITNSLLLNKKEIEKLNDLKIRKIKISLDGTKKNHELIRGKNTFLPTIDKIKLIRKYFKGHIQLGTTLNSKNIKEYKEIIKIAENLKVDSLRLSPVIPFGRMLKNKKLLLSQEDFIIFINEIKNIKNTKIKLDLPDKTRLQRKNKGFGCHCGKETCWILENGDFYPCVFWGEKYKLGNIKKDKLVDLWKRSQEVSNLCGNDICNICSNYEKCKGGCRARAFYEYNDINAIDPFCILKKNKIYEKTLSSFNNTL